MTLLPMRDVGLVVVVIAVAASLVVGFMCGLLSLKAKNRWCATCGASLCCFACKGMNNAASRPSGRP